MKRHRPHPRPQETRHHAKPNVTGREAFQLREIFVANWLEQTEAGRIILRDLPLDEATRIVIEMIDKDIFKFEVEEDPVSRIVSARVALNPSTTRWHQSQNDH
jgi:hypothetical protein